MALSFKVNDRLESGGICPIRPRHALERPLYALI
jgi:hypothetical protein